MDLYKVLSVDREIELAGQTFTVGKLTMKDQAEFDLWVDERVKSEVKKILKEMNKENDVDAYIKLKYNPDIKLQISASTTTTLYLVHKLISKKHEISFDAFCELLTVDDLNVLDKFFGQEDDSKNLETVKDQKKQ